jgi:glycosyltransferase involved in cell wall biosynthesis
MVVYRCGAIATHRVSGSRTVGDTGGTLERWEPMRARGAIVHDWFQGYHGAERVVEVMRAGVFGPDAPPDVFTFEAARELLPTELARAIVRESRLANLPGIRQRGHDPGRWRYLLPYMPYYYRRLDLDDYDVVISSAHACAHHVRPRRDATHVVYCYTPMRYAWLPETDAQRVEGIRGIALRAVTRHLRRLDAAAAQRPDAYAAISTAVQERIRRFYGRESTVIHPPVDIDDLDGTRTKEKGRFLWVHRLVSYKHPLTVAEAFRGLPYTLTMVGVGPLEARLRASLPPNVTLLGWISREQLADLYAHASGFIHVGEEDFGITMVEAMGSGTPVIALARGGSLDIVRDGTDGLLIAEPDVELVRDAVRKLAERSWEAGALTQRAREFSRARFVDRMLGFLHEAQASS